MDRRAFLSLTSTATALWLARPGSAWGKSLPKDGLTGLSLHEAAARVRDRDVSPVELTKACFARIERYDSKINSFITVTSQLALAQAQAAEKEIRAGRLRGPLHGIPIALKDNIETAGVRTTAGSAEFINRIPSHDAEVVRRLKQAGAVLLGKLNVGPVGSHWGRVHNPWALDHECGYSSSGAGAAVAADFCFGAIGTDFAGSVRMPASGCGVVGLKPTHGRVSNAGVVGGQGPLHHVGPLCKTVLDTALLLQSIAAPDSGRANSAEMDVPDYAAAIRQRSELPRLGIPNAGFLDDLDPQIAPLLDDALAVMRQIGAKERDNVAIPLHWEIYEMYEPVARDSAAPRLENNVDPERAVQEARMQTAALFKDVDLLITPTWKRLPMTLDEREKTWPPARVQLMRDVGNLVPFNVLGLPAISVPCGYTQNGLPVGLQIVGRPFAETQVLAFAHAYEQATKWHSRKPNL